MHGLVWDDEERSLFCWKVQPLCGSLQTKAIKKLLPRSRCLHQAGCWSISYLENPSHRSKFLDHTRRTTYPTFTIWPEDGGQGGALCWPLSGEEVRIGLHSSGRTALKPWSPRTSDHDCDVPYIDPPSCLGSTKHEWEIVDKMCVWIGHTQLFPYHVLNAETKETMCCICLTLRSCVAVPV